ncbi:MobA-like NTP transferase domain-containing protein [Bordetella sputigena]|uniref:nucleotidyltransferase family protein n=1 Tax=Bordetella sputigena TaxID=1416810 RepID=UPI0039EF2C54
MSLVSIDRRIRGALDNRCVGILLAAGRGERFRASAGRAGAEKLLELLPDGRTVAAASADVLLRTVPLVLAVTRPDTPALQRVLAERGCVVVETADAARGMGASLAHAARELMAGVAAAASGDAAARAPLGCLVALADMPWVMDATVLAVQEAARGHRIAAPVYEGRRGHPVAFGWTLMPELAGLDGDEGARALLKRHGVCEVPCADPGVLRDIDTVDDLS